MKALVLIGLRRAGKTTAGAAAARILGRPFADVDASVTETTGRTPAAWIAGAGLPVFRAVERGVAARAAATPGVVLATGGGTPLDPVTRERLRRAGRVVYLRAGPEVLAARAAADPDLAARPLLVGGSPADEARLHFAERDPLFRSFADEIVDAEGPLERTVATLVAIASRAEN